MFSYIGLILGLLATVLCIILLYRLELVNRKILLILFAILLLAMFIFDTYLTALPIVEYNKNLVSGIYFGSIPIEDFGYLLVVIILGPALFERFMQNEERKK